MLEEIKKTAAFVRTRTEDFAPEVGIILGTGLGDFADKIDARFIIEYKDVPGFPVSTVEGHKGRMIFGEIEGRRVVAMQGRFHYYEGYTMQQVTFPVRVMQQIGIKYLFVSNASGGINPSFRVGDLMVITDHINLMPNPLIGPNMAQLSPLPRRSPKRSRSSSSTASMSAARVPRSRRRPNTAISRPSAATPRACRPFPR